MSKTSRIWFQAPALSELQSAVVRLFFALLVWFTIPSASNLVDQPHPVGLAHLFNLTFISNPGVMPAIKWGIIPALAVYVAGRLPLVTLPIILLATMLPGTLDNSQAKNAIQHSQQVVSLITLAQLIYHIAVRKKWLDHSRIERGRWEVFAGQQAIVAAYTVTALTKLLRSGLGWIVDSKNFPIQMAKNIRMQYYNTLESETVQGFWAKTSAWGQELLLHSPNLCRLMLSTGLLLELFALLALLGKRWAASYGLLLIMFHVMVRTLTGLNFRYHMAALFIFLVLPWLLICLVARQRNRLLLAQG